MLNKRTHVFVRQSGLNQIENMAILVTEDSVPDPIESLEQAITDWILETAEGKDAWAESVEDFNIGDLLMNYPCPSLEKCLQKRGLTVLSMEQITPDSMVNFDRVLVDSTRLENEDLS